MIVVPPSREVLTLDGPGAVLWHSLATPTDIANASSALSAAYGAPVDMVAADVQAIVRDLMSRGAVIPEPVS